MKLAAVVMLCAALLAQPPSVRASWIESNSGTLTIAGDFYSAAINPDGTMNVYDASGSVMLIAGLGGFEGRYTGRGGETTATASGLASVSYVETQPGARAVISTQLHITGGIPPAPPVDVTVALGFTVEKSSSAIICAGRLTHNTECEVDEESFSATVQDMPTSVYRRDGTWGQPVIAFGGVESGWWPQGTEGHAPTCAAWEVGGVYPVRFWGAPNATSNWLTMPFDRYEESSGSIEYAGAWSTQQQTYLSGGSGMTSTTVGSTATLANRTGVRWIQAWTRRSASDDSKLKVRLRTNSSPFADVCTVDLRSMPANVSSISAPAALVRSLDPAAAYSLRLEAGTTKGLRLDCFDAGGTTRVTSCLDSAIDTGLWTYYPYYEGVGSNNCQLNFGSLAYGASGWQFADGGSVDTSKYYGPLVKLASTVSLSNPLDLTITVKTQSGSTRTFDWSYPPGTTAVLYLGLTDVTSEYTAVHRPRVLQTADTAALAAGDWVYVTYGTRNTPCQVTRVVSVDSPTQVTLQDPISCGGGPSNNLKLVPLFTDVLACTSASPGSTGATLSFNYNAVSNGAPPNPASYKLCKQKHVWPAGSELDVEMVFSAGSNAVPLVKAYAPYGYDSVLCLSEHADGQDEPSSTAIARGSSSPSAPEYDTQGFAPRRLPFTKTIFDRAMKDEALPSALRNRRGTTYTSFKNTLDYMYGQGFEIGLHTPRSGDDYPDGTHGSSAYLEPALSLGSQLYGMRCWIDHGPAANREDLSSCGFRGSFISPTTPDTAELLLDHGFETAWTEMSGWRASGTTGSASANILRPGSELDYGYQMPKAIFPTFWSNPDVGGARYRKLGLISDFTVQPYSGQLAPARIDAVIAGRGVCMVHEYFSEDGRVSGEDPCTMTWNGDTATIDPTFSSHLDAIAARRDACKLWVANVSDFWEFIRARDAVRIEPLDGTRYRITNTADAPIYGLTLYAPTTAPPAAQARLDGLCIVRAGKSFNARQEWVGQAIVLPPLAAGQVSILDLSGPPPADMPTIAPSGTEPSFWATWDEDTRVCRFGTQNPYFPGTQQTYTITCPAYANRDVRIVARIGGKPQDAAAFSARVGGTGRLDWSFVRERESNEFVMSAGEDVSFSISDVRDMTTGSTVRISSVVVTSDKYRLRGLLLYRGVRQIQRHSSRRASSHRRRPSQGNCGRCGRDVGRYRIRRAADH